MLAWKRNDTANIFHANNALDFLKQKLVPILELRSQIFTVNVGEIDLQILVKFLPHEIGEDAEHAPYYPD